MQIRVGMIQMEVVFHKPRQNLARAAQMVAQAAAEGAQICILPECMDLGWATPLAKELAQPVNGEIGTALCRIAKENHVWLVAGMTERVGEQICNAALLISAQGELAGRHHKINLLTGIEDMYTVGSSLQAFDTPFGKVGITICADNAIQSVCLGASLARMGAQMILSPCAWAVRPDRDPVAEPYGSEWHRPYGRLSKLYGIPVIGVSNVGQVPVGTWAGWQAIGNSIAYHKGGEPLAVLPYGASAECVRVISVETEAAARTGTALAEYAFQWETFQE